MPARNVKRCPAKGDAAKLDFLDELFLTIGHTWNISTEPRLADLKVAWEIHGKTIKSRWIKALPGSRPIACYYLDGLKPWTWVNDIPACRDLLNGIPGVDVRIDMSGACFAPEFEHLADAGILDDDEIKRAERRLMEPYPARLSRYELISETR